MESRHIRWEYNEAIPIKKEILYSQLNLINVINHIRTYKLARKQSNAVRNKIKTDIASMRIRINQIISNLPKQEKTYKAIKILEKSAREKQSSQEYERTDEDNLHKELEEIKAKLAQFD